MAYASTRQEWVSEINGPPFQVALYIFCPLLPPAEQEMLPPRVVGMLPTARVERGLSEGARSASTEDIGGRPTLSSSKLACSILSRTVVTAAAGIRALLVSCHSEAPRPVLTGGAACSTYRSTMSRNGTSCCAKRGFAMASNRALALAAAARLSFPPSNGEFPPAPGRR